MTKLSSQALKGLKSDCDCDKIGLDSTYQFSLRYKIRSMSLHTHDISEMGLTVLEPGLGISITRELFQEYEKTPLEKILY